MKSIVIPFVVLTLIMAPLSYGQQVQTSPDDTVVVHKSDLTPDQLNKLATDQKVKELNSTVQQASQWAGAGKEIGIAIKDGLGAASDGVANFASTPPGKLTMFLIAWKVMYKDVLETAKSLVGIPILIFANWFLLALYWRATRTRTVLVSSEGWFKKKTYNQQETWFTKLEATEAPWVIGLFLIFVFIVNWVIVGAVIIG